MVVVIRGKARICKRCNTPNEPNRRRCMACGGWLSKYLNRKVQMDGHTFDSEAEAERYNQLRLMERAGRIKDLKVHPVFEIEVKGKRICDYEGDFSYLIPMRQMINDGETVHIVWGPDGAGFEKIVEDVKSEPTKTATYVLKRKLMLAVHGISIREV